MQKAAVICLSLYLLAMGILSFIPLDVPYRNIILGGLAIAAGLLVLLSLKSFSPGPTAIVLLGITLILMGLESGIETLFPYQANLTAVLQIVTGVFLFVRGIK